MFCRTVLTAAAATAVVAATLAPAQAAAYTVTASAPATADVGALFKITGKSSPGKTLSVQQYSGSRWRTISTVKTASSGSYVRSVKMPSVGAKKYRVVAPAKGSVKTGISPTRTVTGYTWLALVNQPHLSGGYHNWDVNASVAGSTYSRSVQYANAGSASVYTYFNVAGRCDKINVGLGIDDRSGSEAGVPLDVVGFGDSGGLTQYYTDGSPVTTTIRKLQESMALQVKTLLFSANLGSGSVVALTTPKVHCSISRLPAVPLIG